MSEHLKYDTKINDVDLSGSHGIILSQIKPNSKILECGCATGYMTKYMSEQLKCSVYIVEYDSDAFKIASQYAKDGICADLMKDNWEEKFSKIKFDYVIFADVLEHLQDPLSVLIKAQKLLQDDGTALVSIPNVTHNDVIVNMMNNTWKYTKLGLLDNTHIHFWGEKDIVPFFKSAGMVVTRKDYTIVHSGFTEQSSIVDFRVKEFLEERYAGNIYQFVIAAKKISHSHDNNEIDTNIDSIKTLGKQILGTLYYSENNNFAGAKCVQGFYTPPYYKQRFYLHDKNARFLRFDPVEGQQCVVWNIKGIADDGSNFNLTPINGQHYGDYDIFLNSDPAYYINFNGAFRHWIDISFRIELVKNSEIGKVLFDVQEKVNALEKKNEMQKDRIDTLNSRIHIIRSYLNRNKKNNFFVRMRKLFKQK